MALAQDLMGLGVSPLVAQRTATAGIGPVAVTAVAGAASYASGFKIGSAQFLITASPSAVAGVSLPAIGTDGGAFLADDYIINNQGSATLQVRASTGVLISVNGALSSLASIVAHTTTVFWSVSSTYTAGTANWIGISGT